MYETFAQIVAQNSNLTNSVGNIVVRVLTFTLPPAILVGGVILGVLAGVGLFRSVGLYLSSIWADADDRERQRKEAKKGLKSLGIGLLILIIASASIGTILAIIGHFTGAWN